MKRILFLLLIIILLSSCSNKTKALESGVKGVLESTLIKMKVEK